MNPSTGVTAGTAEAIAVLTSAKSKTMSKAGKVLVMRLLRGRRKGCIAGMTFATASLMVCGTPDTSSEAQACGASMFAGLAADDMGLRFRGCTRMKGIERLELAAFDTQPQQQS